MIHIKIIFLFINTFVVKFIFDWLYVNYIYNYFSYDTFYLDYSNINFYLSTFLIFLTVFSIYFLDKYSTSIKIPIYILFFSLILPLSTITAFESMDILFFTTIIFSFNLLVIINIVFPRINIKAPSAPIIYLASFMFIIIYIYTYTMLLFTGGLLRINFNLSDVYETREILSTSSFFMSGYFISWIGYTFNPLIIVFGLYKKNYKLLLFGIFLQLLLFGMTNYKTFLFSIPLIIVIYFILKFKNHFVIVGFGVMSILLGFYGHFLISKDILLSSIFIRRQFFMPAHLHHLYNDFFKDNSFIKLSDSIFEYILQYPYQTSVTRVISMEYWGKDFGPNVGVFGNAYYNFGNVGVFIFTLILAFIFKYINSLDLIVPKRVVGTIILLPTMALINSGLLTTLLTHSLLIALFCIWVYSPYFKKEN